MRRGRRDGAARGIAGLLLLMGAGAALRLMPWPGIFTADGVRLVGNDAYYHLLRIQRTIESFPRVPWRDPWLSYPDGATIPWPPGFDGLVAWAAMVVGWGEPSVELVERVGALAPVVLGVLTLPLVAGLAWVLLGRASVLWALFFLAVLPAHVLFSSLGRLDQHVAEVLLFDGILLAFVASWSWPGRSRRAWCADLLLGLGVAAAFWTWPGSGLTLAFLLGFAALWHVVAPAGDLPARRMLESLARGGAAGAALLVASLAVFAPTGSLTRMELTGLSGFHAALVGITAGGAALLWLFRRRGVRTTRGRRLLEACLASTLAAVPPWVLLPDFRAAVQHGLTALGREGAWYRNIQEFDPLLFAGYESLGTELLNVLGLFGLGLLLMPVAALHWVRSWPREPSRHTGLGFLLYWGAVFLVLALARQRFVLYLATPLALYLASAGALVADLLGRRLSRSSPSRRLAPAVVLVGILAPTTLWYAEPLPTPDPDLVRSLAWLRRQEPTPAHRAGVLAEWAYGHHIQYLARKPVLVGPFGTDVGLRAMQDSAAFFLSSDPAAAAELLDRRRVGFVLLSNPVTETHFAHGFAPPGTRPVVDVIRRWSGPLRVEVDPAFWGLVVSRLYFFDGLVPPGYEGEALGSYRLVFESETDHAWGGVSTKRFKIFQVVPGARVAVATPPYARVTARTRLVTNQGRRVEWFSTTAADGAGTSSLRLPYATGPNGALTASSYTVTSGARRVELRVTPGQVARGETLDLELDANPEEPRG